MEIDQSIEITVENVFDRVILIAATGLFALTVILTTLQVIVRQTPFLPSEWFIWTVPAARFLLIIMTYVGGAVVTRNNEHISISLILDWLGQFVPRLRTSLMVVSDVIVIAFLGMALYGTYLSTTGNWRTSVGGISGITSGYIYLGIGLGLLAMLVYEVDDAVEAVQSLLTGDWQTTTDETDDEGGVEDV
jgi:TRAP-type C4-dicarboxylate transport system permease small subunit